MTKFQLIQKLMEKSNNLAQQDAKAIVNIAIHFFMSSPSFKC